MGIERFLIGATLRLSVAQRLVRRLCAHCRKPRPITAAEALSLGRKQLEGTTVYDSGGCVYCAGRGYSGRVAMFEMVEMDQDMARAIGDGAGESEILAKLRSKQTPLLIDDALEKMMAGMTTIEEVMAAVVDW